MDRKSQPRRSTEQNPVKVLVCDPQRMVGEALSIVLSHYSDIKVSPTYPRSAEELLSEIHNERPDIVLIDYHLPDCDSPELIREITGSGAGTKVIVLSWYHGTHDIEAVLDAGAAGFFPKSLTVAQVAEGIRRAHSGESPVYLDELEELFGRLSKRADQATKALEELKILSPRELEVLTLMSLDRSAKEVAEELSISLSTVKMYVRNMLKKTGCLSTQEVLVKARFAGLLRT